MATETKRIDDASIPLVTDLNGVTIPVMQVASRLRVSLPRLRVTLLRILIRFSALALCFTLKKLKINESILRPTA